MKVTSNPKYITTALNKLEQNDEVLFNTDNGNYESTVAHNNDNGDDAARVGLDGGGVLFVEYTGERGGTTTADADEFNAFYQSIDGDVEPVNAIRTGEPTTINSTISGLPDSRAKDAAQIRGDFEQSLDIIHRGMTELQEMRRCFEAVLNDDMTLAEMEAHMSRLEVESGGTMAVDKGLGE